MGSISHVCAMANTGATKEDVMEALMLVAVYAGVPGRRQRGRRREEGVCGDGRVGAAVWNFREMTPLIWNRFTGSHARTAERKSPELVCNAPTPMSTPLPQL